MANEIAKQPKNTTSETASVQRPAPAGDPILRITGSFGPYQLMLCIIVFSTKFFIAFHQMAIIFLNPKISFKCGEVVKKCPCENPTYVSEFFEKTMEMEWNLICERLSLASLQQATFQFGVLFGSVFFGMAADRYGRRKPLLIAIVIQIVCGVGASFSHNYWIFLILRVLVGFSVGGTMTTSFVILMEFVGPQYREVLSALYQIPFNLGHFLLPVIAYFIRDFHDYQMAISAPGIIMLSCFWCPDTPRWLISINRTEEACKILTTAAKRNNRPTEQVKSLVDEYHASLGSANARKGTILDLFKTKNIRKNTICMSLNWLACSYCFYGVSQYVGQLMGNPFLNVGVSALLTTLGTLASIPVLKIVGRRTILIFGNGASAACLLLLGILPADMAKGPASIILATIGVMASFIVFVTVYLYTSELFPTVIRNAAVGLSSSSARVGSILAPFVIDLQTTAKWLPPICFALLPAIACAVSFALPETKGCRLMATIAEAEAFGTTAAPDNNNNNIAKPR